MVTRICNSKLVHQVFSTNQWAIGPHPSIFINLIVKVDFATNTGMAIIFKLRIKRKLEPEIMIEYS